MPTPSRQHAPKQTLEQQRAAKAWAYANGCSDEYKNLAKGAPALIMNNGLMQALAFYQDKATNHERSAHAQLVGHLCDWLNTRGVVTAADYAGVMQALFNADSATYRRATQEVLDLLKWLRQFAAASARQAGGEGAA